LPEMEDALSIQLSNPGGNPTVCMVTYTEPLRKVTQAHFTGNGLFW
jgi:hypothetical protein